MFYVSGEKESDMLVHRKLEKRVSDLLLIFHVVC